MASIAWEVAERAIVKWLQRSLAGEVDAGSIYWIRQWNGRPPNGVSAPYITLALPSLRRVGGRDGKRYTKVGDVVTQHVFGPRVVRLEIQCFGENDVKATRAAAYLDTALTCLELDVNKEAFRVANIAVGPIDAITTLSKQEDFEPRAVVELDIHLSANVAAPSNEILFVEMVNETMGDGPDAITTWVPEEPPEDP